MNVYQTTKNMSQSDFATYVYRFVQTLSEPEREVAERGVCYQALRCERCKCKKEAGQDDTFWCCYCESVVLGACKD